MDRKRFLLIASVVLLSATVFLLTPVQNDELTQKPNSVVNDRPDSSQAVRPIYSTQNISRVSESKPKYGDIRKYLSDLEIMIQTTGESISQEDYINRILDAESVNSDTVGWLYCSELGIDYPVFKGEDNYSYLRTNRYGEKSSSGELFMDCRCDLELAPLVKMIHGHNMKDGSMFARVPSLLGLDSVLDAPKLFYCDSDFNVTEFSVISVLSVSVGKEAIPVDLTATVSDVAKLRDKYLERSVVPNECVDKGMLGNSLLILNTCWYGYTGTEHGLHCVVVCCS